MVPTILRYTSAFGVFTVPKDVEDRALRLERRFGRTGYLNAWCKWQWEQRLG